MAAGPNKNRGSRHRSHRHRQQKGEAQSLLRHASMNSSSPRTMEPLTDKLEAPSAQKQPEMANKEHDCHHDEQKKLHGLATKRRKKTLGDSASVIDRWDGEAGVEESTTSLTFLGSNFSTDIKGKSRSTNKGGSINANIVPVGKNQSGDMARERTSPNLVKDKQMNNSPLHMMTSSAESERKRARKGDTWVVQGVMRNIELDNRLENWIRRHIEESCDRDRWREGIKQPESKGSGYRNEEHQDVRLMEERGRHEKPKNDGDLKGGRDSVSGHRDQRRRKVSRPSEHQQAKDESFDVSEDCEGRGKHENDYEQRKKNDRNGGDRSLEKKVQDDRKEEALSNKEELQSSRNKDVLRDAKERDERAPEVRNNESQEKSRNTKMEAETRTIEDILFSSGKAEERDNKLDKNLRDVKEKVDEHRDEEACYVKNRHDKKRDGKEKVDKHRDEEVRYARNRNDKRRGELNWEDDPKHKGDLKQDGVADDKGRKKNVREPGYDLKHSKLRTEEGAIEKQQDGKDMIDRQKREHHMDNGRDIAKQANNPVRHGKLPEGNDKGRDEWVSGERGGRERTQDDANRHGQHADSKERRWRGSVQYERGGTNKETYNRQKHGWDMDERTRFGAHSEGKDKGDKGKDGRKQHDRPNDDIYMPGKALERSQGSKQSSRKADMGDQETRYINSDKGNHGDWFNNNSRDMNGQLKFRGTFEPPDARESEGHGTGKADRTGPRASKSCSEDQERVLSGPGANDASTSEKSPKTAYDTGTHNLVPKDFPRARGRQADDTSGLPHEDKPLQKESGWKDKLEASVSVSSSGGTRQPRDQNWPRADQGKHYLGHHEERVRTWEPQIPNKEPDDERRRPYSHERPQDSLSPRGPVIHGHEDFGRSADSMPSRDASMLKRKHDKRAGPTKHRWGDTFLGERSDWGNWPSTGRPLGRPLPPNHHLGQSGLLPPPPPYRPGIDNPTVMVFPDDFVESSSPKESKRYERKPGRDYLRWSEMVEPGDLWTGFGMGRLHSHNQGPFPGPANMLPFFPQAGSGYLGVGQQFQVPQVFRSNGSRLLANMRYPDRREGHHFMHAREGLGRYADERQTFVDHSEWDEFSQGFAVGGWEGVSEPRQHQPEDATHEFHSNREDLYPGKLTEGPWSDSETDNAHPIEDNKPETSNVSPVHTYIRAEGYTGKDNNRPIKQRKLMVLLHVHVCKQLVDTDLYKEYLSFLPPPEAKKQMDSPRGDVCVSAAYVDNDLEFEVDAEAEDLLICTSPSVLVLPRLPDNTHQDALKLFRRPLRHYPVQKLDVGSFLLPPSVILWPSVNASSSLMGRDLRISASLRRLDLVDDDADHGTTFKSDEHPRPVDETGRNSPSSL